MLPEITGGTTSNQSAQAKKIEILWRRIKYKWLPFAAYTDFKALLDSIQHILRHYGQQYRIDFQIT